VGSHENAAREERGMGECQCNCGSPGATCADERLPVDRMLRPTTGTLTARDRLDHLKARWGFDREGHMVEPGLYALGRPGAESPVFVSANYTLSFDTLRSALVGTDCYILVLDTKGINVWCAAGKGTFGTDELAARVASVGLADVVAHRELVVPQLGATGVSAREVHRRTGFEVRFGPVRAEDIPEFMESGSATPEMRRVRFGLAERAVLIPVELTHVLLPTLVAAVVLYFLGGPIASWAAVISVAAGVVAFPVLLPWLPTPNFSTRGEILGLVAALPFSLTALLSGAGGPAWARVGWALVFLAGMPQVTAYLSLNFTGSTTFTSRTGVKREIFSYFPLMAWTFGASVVLVLVISAASFFGGRG
jgi:uncharacterized membrane protein YuzA (DUF378 family)